MTPYEIVFANAEFETQVFPSLTAEADEHSADTRDVEEFLQLPSATDVMEKLSPRGSADPPPVTGVAALAFHGYHFWRHGKLVHGIDEARLRACTADGATLGEWAMTAPGTAGYVALPPNLVWAQPGTSVALSWLPRETNQPSWAAEGS